MIGEHRTLGFGEYADARIGIVESQKFEMSTNEGFGESLETIRYL